MMLCVCYHGARCDRDFVCIRTARSAATEVTCWLGWRVVFDAWLITELSGKSFHVKFLRGIFISVTACIAFVHFTTGLKIHTRYACLYLHILSSVATCIWFWLLWRLTPPVCIECVSANLGLVNHLIRTIHSIARSLHCKTSQPTTSRRATC